MKDDGKSMSEPVKKFDFSKLDFDILREREIKEAARRRAEMERIRREEEEAAAAPPPVIFSEEEHNSALAAAFENGKSEGLRSAAAEQNREILDLMKLLVPKIEELCSKEDERKKYFEEQTVKIAAAIVGKILPGLMKKESANEIFAFIADAVKGNPDAVSLRITVPAELKDVIRERLNVMFDDRKYQLKTEVTCDDGMSFGSCRIEWSDVSGIETDTTVILKKLEDITGCCFEAVGGKNI